MALNNVSYADGLVLLGLLPVECRTEIRDITLLYKFKSGAMSTRKIWRDKIEWYVINSYLCIWFHFHEIHVYTCSCTILGYCYTQHSHHSCVFRQHIRPSLENQKRSFFCAEPVFMFLSRVLWCCCFPFVCFNWFLRSYNQLFYFCCIVTMLPPVPWLHILHINRHDSFALTKD